MPSFRQTLLLIASLTVATPAFAWGAACTVSKNLRETIDTSGITHIEINALAGDLEIRGENGDEVQIDARVCTSHEKWLDALTLDIDRQDDTLIVTVIIPPRDNSFDPRYAYVDLTAVLPRDIPTEVRDSSGNADIDGVNLALVDDSSGDVDLRDTSGDLMIRDSSGGVDLRGHDGNLEVVDSSGDLTLEEVTGEVLIKRDSSGDIDIETAGSVHIMTDSSGEIEIRNVTANVEIGSDSAGGIRIRGVGGEVLVGRDGSGDIVVADVAGNLTVEADGSGKVHARGVEGQIYLP